ncbi:Pfs domain-containing protein [Fusarium mundagurra]|uniref:Pfs domain-containing protein n=1 Tax=Fusarium mundagurra TaxID=1567541 RepID=A0A8H6DDU8_9HYPO|nr:Pfs domain-containing protein [Fusarium mundagurra]
MRRATQGRPQGRPYPCVVAHRYPEYCKRSFNNIEKLNEHIKRCHSPFLWCSDCLKKFNSLMSREALEREKEYHKAICPKEPSEKNKALREKAYVIDEARYELCKKLGWKLTAASHEFNKEGGIESVNQRSWRQIYATVFPTAPSPLTQEPDKVSDSFLSIDALVRPHYDADLLDSSSGSKAQNSVPPSISLPSDSGYESLKREVGSLPAMPHIPEVLEDVNDPTRDDASDSALTLYSDGLSLPDADQDNYKSEFCEAIFHQISAANEAFEPLKDSLPDLLRSFALRLGSLGSAKDTEVMWFIHKHRYDIARRFCEAAEDVENSEILPETGRKPFDKPNIIDWLRGVSIEQRPDIDSLHSASDEELEEELEEQPSLLDRKGYRETVFKSFAFKWLVDDLVKSMTLQTTEEDAGVRLRQDISRHLANDQYISKRKASKHYKVTFSANWNPDEYLREQFKEPYDLGRLLGETITLTGSITDAQALPCAEYLSQTWPNSGLILLDLLRFSLVSGKPVSATIGEQIGWLGAALRSSFSEAGLATCCPDFHSSWPGVGPLHCTIEYPVTQINPEPQGLGEGMCWHAMFRNPVIVTGYPIPKRKRYRSGLEVPLNVMSGLTMSPRIHKYKGRHFFKGFSTALVPTGKIDDMIFWHFFYHPEGSHLPYPHLDDTEYPDVDHQDLTRARHVVGWCSQAKGYAGAPGMNYDIGVTQLNQPGREFALEKVSFSVGQLVTAGCQFAIGRKDRHVNATRGTYKDKLECLDWNYVTLWDVDEKRGWLLSGTAALLHLLRASLEHCRTDKFRSEFLFQADEFQESMEPHSMQSVMDVLLSPTNRKLKLYVKDEYSYEERKLLPDGQVHVETKTIITYKTIKDRVEELYETLEKLIDHTVSSSSSFKGINAKRRPHDHLEGWDFADIAKDRDPFVLKKTNLPLSLMGWGDMTRAIPSITLFGKGFGDLIVASRTGPDSTLTNCSEWEKVPKGKNLLCVRNWDLREIIRRTGNQTTTPITVVPGLLWKSSSSSSPFRGCCSCESDGGNDKTPLHHAIQHLVPTKHLTNSDSVVDLDKHIDGAVIFGPWKQWEYPWRSADTGSPGGEPAESMVLGNSDTSSQPTTGNSRSITPSVTISSEFASHTVNIHGAGSDHAEDSQTLPSSTQAQISHGLHSGIGQQVPLPDTPNQPSSAQLSLPGRLKKKADELLETCDEPGIFGVSARLFKKPKKG